jgi:hypothetical protein
MNKKQFFERFKGVLSAQQLEQKWKVYEEELRLLEMISFSRETSSSSATASAAAGAGGGGGKSFKNIVGTLNSKQTVAFVYREDDSNWKIKIYNPWENTLTEAYDTLLISLDYSISGVYVTHEGGYAFSFNETNTGEKTVFFFTANGVFIEKKISQVNNTYEGIFSLIFLPATGDIFGLFGEEYHVIVPPAEFNTALIDISGVFKQGHIFKIENKLFVLDNQEKTLELVLDDVQQIIYNDSASVFCAKTNDGFLHFIDRTTIINSIQIPTDHNYVNGTWLDDNYMLMYSTNNDNNSGRAVIFNGDSGQCDIIANNNYFSIYTADTYGLTSTSRCDSTALLVYGDYSAAVPVFAGDDTFREAYFLNFSSAEIFLLKNAVICFLNINDVYHKLIFKKTGETVLSEFEGVTYLGQKAFGSLVDRLCVWSDELGGIFSMLPSGEITTITPTPANLSPEFNLSRTIALALFDENNREGYWYYSADSTGGVFLELQNTDYANYRFRRPAILNEGPIPTTVLLAPRRSSTTAQIRIVNETGPVYLNISPEVTSNITCTGISLAGAVAAIELKETEGGLYNFSDEGGDNQSINDGGDDMYAGANFLGTNLNSGIVYTHTQMNESPDGGVPFENYIMDGTVQDGSYFFGNGASYFTNMYPGMFVMCATDVQPDVINFFVEGNIGADGGGSVEGGSFQKTSSGNQYTVFYKFVGDAGDPSINHLIIIDGDGTEVIQNYDTESSDDDHSIHNIQTSVIYFLVIAKTNGVKLTLDQAQHIAGTFLDLVSEKTAAEALSSLNENYSSVTQILPTDYTNTYVKYYNLNGTYLGKVAEDNMNTFGNRSVSSTNTIKVFSVSEADSIVEEIEYQDLVYSINDIIWKWD